MHLVIKIYAAILYIDEHSIFILNQILFFGFKCIIIYPIMVSRICYSITLNHDVYKCFKKKKKSDTRWPTTRFCDWTTNIITATKKRMVDATAYSVCLTKVRLLYVFICNCSRFINDARLQDFLVIFSVCVCKIV